MEPNGLFNILNNSTSIMIKSSDTASICKMAAKIAEHNFVWRYFTMLVIGSSLDAATAQVLCRYYRRGLVVTTADHLAPSLRNSITQFIIVCRDTLDVTHTLTWLVNSMYDTSGRYIIVCSSTDCDEHIVVALLSRYGIADVLFVKHVGESPAAAVYDYTPITPGNCNNTEPRLLNRLHATCQQDKCYENLFRSEKVNMHMCPYITAGFHLPPSIILDGTHEPSGVDGEITKVLAYKLNGTLTVKTPGNDSEDDYTSSTNTLFSGEAHSFLMGAIMFNNTFKPTKMTYPYDYRFYLWMTAIAENKRPWEVLLYPLQDKVWLAVVGTFAAIIILSWFMKRAMSYRNIRRVLEIKEDTSTNNALVFNSFILFLGLPIEKLSNNWRAQVVVLVWIWCTFLLRCSYTSALLISLKTKHFDDYIHNIFEAHKKYGAKHGGHPGFKIYYMENPKFYNDWLEYEYAEQVIEIEKVMNGTSDIILLLDDRLTIYEFAKATNVRARLKFLQECAFVSPTVFYLNKKYSMLVPTINAILLRMTECGFIQHNKDRFYRASYEKWLNHNNDLQKDIARPITIKQLEGLYIVYSICVFISTVIFLAEIIIVKFRN